MSHQPKIGVGVAVIKNNQVLLGKRKNAHGEDTWSFPGGHLEFNESWEDCAKHETLEETGITIKNVHFGTATNDIFQQENKHYVTLIMLAEPNSDKKPTFMEPIKCVCWKYFSWDNLPQPLFQPIQNLLKKQFNPITTSK
jgi:8-oxo-dGTP diphosphatase